MKNIAHSAKKSVLLLAALVAISPLAGAAETNKPAAEPKPSARPMDLFADEIVAKGDDVKVTRAMLDDALITIKASAAARGQTIPPQAMKGLEAQVLSRLIGMQLLNQSATPADKTAGDEAAQKQLEIMKKSSGSEENFSRQLKTVGMTLDELTQKLREEGTAEAILKREIKFDVSDADAKKFYEENPSQFEQPELVRAAHILISTRDKDGGELADAKKKEKRKLAEDLIKRAKEGEDFGKLAKEYSEDPGSKDKGGEYTFPRGQMVPEFEAVAFSQETNQISDVVTTQFGYHIIKTLEKTPAKTVEFAEAEDDIKKFLETRGMQRQIPGYMEKLEKAANVEVLDKDLKSAIENATAAAKRAAEESSPSTQE